MLKRIHAIVSGRVQGVGFRWTTLDVARQLKVRGWVRNMEDGRVEVMAEGEEQDLKYFIEFLRRGPKYAKVKDVTVRWLDYLGEFEIFNMRY
ncbi:MAG: acylphosphatase [Candidatus Helarchaeota archaeon]